MAQHPRHRHTPAYYEERRLQALERARKWRLDNPKRYKELNRVCGQRWYKENKDQVCRETRARYLRLKKIVVRKYGGRCACCGVSELVFLAVDHVNNDGAKMRKEKVHGHGVALYHWLIRRGFPKDFQILCHNCNWAKAHGGCPHARPTL
ncbi:hypothetical protein LCGC14_1460340 [marine sediment metagenome]|uniref:Uncharacterized protein n=1 Tax=marine sediment metagenome TaxID=412755 RepID=A0A0F9JF94_9ZZZZ